MKKGWVLRLFLGLTFISLSLFVSAAQQALEWRLEVSAESARIHLKPDINSPVVAIVSRGTKLTSYFKEREWFRVIPGPGQEGVVSIGYIAPADVSVLEEKIRKESDFWGSQAEAYRGIGLTVKLGGGVHAFARGDIDRGAMGLYDAGVESLNSLGFTMFSREVRPFGSGFNLNGDILYRIAPRLSLDLGFDYASTKSTSLQQFGRNEFQLSNLTSEPSVNSVDVRLGLQYEFSLVGFLKSYLGGGPSLNFANYSYGFGNKAGGEFEDTTVQDAKGSGLGLWGVAGLEVAMNDRVGFFVEAQGRYAKISNLKGTERSDHWKNYMSTVTQASGYVYLVEDGVFPRLAVLPADSAASLNARRAAFDFSGVSLVAGLKVRF
jgi:opacity protein-like surface antigen